jgi:hypothetical protein
MSKQQFPKAEFRLPPGRFIRGSMTSKTTTGHNNQPLAENKHHFWVAVAVEKTAPGVADIVNGIVSHVWQSYSAVAGSQGVLQQIGYLLAAPSFAWKLDDGDTDAKWSQREGARGCYIFQMSTTQNLNVFDAGNIQADPKIFQLGDYVDAVISVTINGEVGGTAGLYMNPVGIRWLAEGPRINVGRDATSLFGAPAGAPYSGHRVQSPPMSQQVMGQQAAPQAAPQLGGPPPALPGQAGPAPMQMQHAAPTPPPPVQMQHQPPAETAQQQAARLGIQHHPGWRIDEANGQWVADATPTPPPAAQPSVPSYGTGNTSPYAHGHAPHTSPNGYPASGQGAPAGAPSIPAPSGVPGGYPQGQTAYHSNNPPPVQPHPGYAAGPPRV